MTNKRRRNKNNRILILLVSFYLSQKFIWHARTRHPKVYFRTTEKRRKNYCPIDACVWLNQSQIQSSSNLFSEFATRLPEASWGVFFSPNSLCLAADGKRMRNIVSTLSFCQLSACVCVHVSILWENSGDIYKVTKRRHWIWSKPINLSDRSQTHKIIRVCVRVQAETTLWAAHYEFILFFAS